MDDTGICIIYLQTFDLGLNMQALSFDLKCTIKPQNIHWLYSKALDLSQSFNEMEPLNSVPQAKIF